MTALTPVTAFALRISCPDRPGSLGAVATALGRVRMNIVALDVVERAAGVAVDHLIVEGPRTSFGAVVEAVEALADTRVELVQRAVRPEERPDPLGLAADVVSSGADPVRILVNGVPAAFDATWCAALPLDAPGAEPVAASPGAPPLTDLRLPGPRGGGPAALRYGDWTPPAWELDPLTASFAVSGVPGHDQVLLVARSRGPAFRHRELLDLGHLARIAGAVRPDA